MHDLDRALQEFEADEGAFGPPDYRGETETEGDYAAETYEADSYEAESDEAESEEGESDEGESDEAGSYEAESYEAEGYDRESDAESDHEAESDSAAVFDELEEMEQAASLLEVQDEDELDRFLGGLISTVKKKLGSYLPPGLQQTLADSLKSIARTALPKIGGAVGNLVLPGVGGGIGAGVGSNAAKLFGLELEGMSYEDQQFEVARRLVALGAQATKVATQDPSAVVSPHAAKDAVLQAATTHAPGLASAAALTAAQPVGYNSRRHWRGRQRSGRWFRRGHRIILVGV